LTYRSRFRRKKIKEKNKSAAIKILATIFTLSLILTIGILALSFTAFNSVTADLPKIEDLHPKESRLTSKVYAADGTLIAEFHGEENRELVSFDDISDNVKTAVLAVEDKNFYTHKGYDPMAIIRAFMVNLQSGRIVEGASTLTQQYIRTIYLSLEQTWNRKLIEAYLAWQLEQRYTKDQIFEHYLNTVYFGEGAYGIQAAAKTYFGVDARDLDLPQAALLAGLPQSPNTLSPFIDMAAAQKRRNHVLDLMVEAKFITSYEAEQAKNAPIILKNKLINTYTFAPYFVEYVKQELIREYGVDTLFGGGLTIYTTIDPKTQKYAEEAMDKVLFDPNDPASAFVAIDPKTGYIKAMVGGKDFTANKFNLATQAKRQPGSTFKVFVLISALENNYSPYMAFRPNGPILLTLPGPDWEVENYFGEQFDVPYMSIFEATKHSVNVVYAQLIARIGAAKVARLAMDMGISTNLDPLPAIGLGGLTTGVSALDMASALATLANKGVHIPPTCVTKIVDKDGNVIFSNVVKGQRVISELTAYRTTRILEQVILGGTGGNAYFGRPAAGKTGTTEYRQDAWFVGYTPDLAAAVWMGHPEAYIKMENIRGERVQGGTFPARMWKAFMEKALEDVEPSNFEKPKDTRVQVLICKDSMKSPVAECPEESLITITVSAGGEPQEYCDIHALPAYPNVTGMPLDQAVQTLEGLGYGVQVLEQPNPNVPSGIVFGQNPDPTKAESFEMIQKGMVVQIAVSQG